MKKYLFLAINTIILVVFLVLPTSIVDAQSSILSGQTQEIDAHLRSNGEAIIISKITFTNNDSAPQTSLKLDIAGQLSEFYSAQVFKPKGIYSYDTTETSGCAINKESSYEDLYLTDKWRNKYSKLNYTTVGTEYTFKLATPLIANCEGELVLTYATKSYVKEELSIKSFDIPTIKSGQRISQANISVTFDDDIYYNGKKSSVKYNEAEGISLNALSANSSSTSESVDRAIANIGNGGAITKQASSLAPGDVFNVKGTYATSWLGLYYKKLITALLVIAGLGILLWQISKWQQKSIAKRRLNSEPTEDNANTKAKDLSNNTKTKEKDSLNSTNLLASDSIKIDSAPQSINKPKLLGISPNNKYIYILKIRLTLYFGVFTLSLISILLTIAVILLYGIIIFRFYIDPYSSDWYFVFNALAITGGIITFILTFSLLPIWLYRRMGLRMLYIFMFSYVFWIIFAVAILKFIPLTNNSDNNRNLNRSIIEDMER